MSSGIRRNELLTGFQGGAGTWEASGGVAGSEAAIWPSLRHGEQRGSGFGIWHLLSLRGGLTCPTPGWSEGFAAEAVTDAGLKPIPLLGFAFSAGSLGGESPLS